MPQLSMQTLQNRLQAVRSRITEAEKRYHRTPGSVQLLAVGKTRPLDDLIAVMQSGQTHFGENHLQQALIKIKALSQNNITWHFIGPIQSNKTKNIALYFDWVHSLDRLSIAQRLNKQRPISLSPLNVCVQVIISNETNKAGLTPMDVLTFARQVVDLPRLQLRGLMTIPSLTSDTAQQRKAFHALSELCSQLKHANFPLDTLSMGMSHDLEAAIAEGATIVRVGTAIFGERQASPTSPDTSTGHYL